MQPRSPKGLKLNGTDAERKLWQALRAKQLGFKFRRQQPLGSYVANFCCWEARLVVEVDGGQHCENRRDDIRTAWLEARGWRVLRFWNNEVLGNQDGVLQAILAALKSPPPAGEG